jgi:hypothetical protein
MAATKQKVAVKTTAKKSAPRDSTNRIAIARRAKKVETEHETLLPEQQPTKRLRGEAALMELRGDIATAAKGVLAKYERKLVPSNRKCSEEKVREILQRVCQGESVSKVLREGENMPSPVVFHDMLARIPELEIEYEKALKRRAEKFGDELVELSDLALGGSPEDVQALKLMVNTRQWIAARLLPKKYGDKVTVAGDADNPLVTQLVVSGGDLVKRIKGGN